ncbi:MAG: chorismate synthase [Thermoplasmatota archaeon]
MSNSLGTLFRVSWFGESHGALVGVLVDGVPPGIAFAESDVQPALDRRRPGQSLLTTQRHESDRVEILSGVFNGHTTGAPVLMLIRNEDKESTAYERAKDTPRPGHSDFVARERFGGFNDYRGGGMFSARLTAAFVMAGALAAKILSARGIEIAAHASRIGGIAAEGAFDIAGIRAAVEKTPVRSADLGAAKRMEEAILAARNAKDSIGGVVECVVEGLPVGVGEPNADSVESALAHALFAIPAVKGVEFGDGFGIAELKGSEARDPYFFDADGRVRTRANHNGGILGGLTTGMPLRFRVALKPTSSIPLNQETVNLATHAPAELEVKGRHDPCVVPRAVPVVEAVAAFVLADLVLRREALR